MDAEGPWRMPAQSGAGYECEARQASPASAACEWSRSMPSSRRRLHRWPLLPRWDQPPSSASPRCASQSDVTSSVQMIGRLPRATPPPLPFKDFLRNVWWAPTLAGRTWRTRAP
eukprot:8694909-Alexandrium_andersonii.AAC.1